MTPMATDVRPCPVCGAAERTLAVSAPGEWLDREHPVPLVEYSYYRCHACETVYLGELPSPEVFATYYESPGYHFHGPQKIARHADQLSRFWWTYLRVMRPLAIRRPGRHLDFGCGPGDYLAFARSQGWETVGVEYSEETRGTPRPRVRSRARIADGRFARRVVRLDYHESLAGARAEAEGRFRQRGPKAPAGRDPVGGGALPRLPGVPHLRRPLCDDLGAAASPVLHRQHDAPGWETAWACPWSAAGTIRGWWPTSP